MLVTSSSVGSRACSFSISSLVMTSSFMSRMISLREDTGGRVVKAMLIWFDLFGSKIVRTLSFLCEVTELFFPAEFHYERQVSQ